MDSQIGALIGKTIKVLSGMESGSGRVDIECEDGAKFVMYHSQDCCESVSIYDVVGDPTDLVGQPILIAEEVVSVDTPADVTHEYEPESQTWTFYKFATIKGYVDLRWLGESNGYYSERVDFSQTA